MTQKKEKMIKNFIDYLHIEKRYSPHTLTNYQKDLDDFLLFLKEKEGTDDSLKVNKKIIKNFIIELSLKKLSKRTINRKLSSLRGYYQFLLKTQNITLSPMEGISSLKFYPEKQIPISQDEMKNLLSFSPERSLLDNLIIEILYQTGIRKSELANLEINNVSHNNLEIKIKGKGNKMRIIPISKALSELMVQYENQERNPLTEYNSFFFVDNKGKKLYEKYIYNVVNKNLNLVTLKKKKSPHILRHSFATHLLNHGAEISKVKKIMGHASLASTQVYTNADIEQLKKVFNHAHPRAKK